MNNTNSKISTAVAITAIAGLLAFSGVFGSVNVSSAATGYSWGPSKNGNPFTVKPDSNVKGVSTETTTTETTTETKKEDTTKTETPTETKKEDIKTETVTDTSSRVFKRIGDTLYSLNKVTTPLSAKLADTECTAGYTTTFTDIDNNDFKDAIVCLQKNGVVSGTQNGTMFEPSRGITRAEFLAITLEAHGYDVSAKPTSLPFNDVDMNSWIANVVHAGLENGLIAGDTKNGKKVFRPNEQISKIEAMAILVSMRDIQVPVDFKHTFKDAAADWQNKVLNVVEYLGLDKADGEFNPNSKISRDVMANSIVKLSKLY